MSAVAVLLLALSAFSSPVPVGEAAAFDVAADTTGIIWLAAAGPDDTLRILRSDDFGASWLVWLALDHAGVTRLGAAVGVAVGSPLCVFALDGANSGDLWLWRVSRDSPTASRVPVSVGPDTIDAFSAAIDREPAPYVYCLYVNERRAGRTGALARSVDFGSTWGPRSEFWNCWNPHITHTHGSVIHCAWRYALTGTEIHHAYNRHYGESRYWSTVRVVARGPARRLGPVIVQADTSDELNAAAWMFFAVAWRESTGRDIGYSLSPRNGDWWESPREFGNSFVEQWPADAAPDLGGPNGFVGLLYFSGGLYPDQPVGLWWTSANSIGPHRWTRPVPVSDRAVRADIRPRILYPRGNAGRLPVFFYATDSGLWCARLWRTARPDSVDAATPDAPAAGPAGLWFDCPAPGRYTLSLYDAAGRLLYRPSPAALAAGPRQFALPTNLAPGACFAVLRGPAGTQRRKLVVSR